MQSWRCKQKVQVHSLQGCGSFRFLSSKLRNLDFSIQAIQIMEEEKKEGGLKKHRIARRSRDEREAKDRARDHRRQGSTSSSSHRREGSSTSVGAFSSTDDRKVRSKTSRSGNSSRGGGDDSGRRERRSREDADAKNKARRNRGSDRALPSAQSVSSEGNSQSNRERRKQRSGDRSKPGASSESSDRRIQGKLKAEGGSSSRSRARLEAEKNSTEAEIHVPGGGGGGGGGEFEVHAMAVDEIEDNERMKALEEQNQKLTNQVQQILTNPQAAAAAAGGPIMAEQETPQSRDGDAVGPGNKCKKYWMCGVILLLAVVGGVVGFLMTRPGDAAAAVTESAPTVAPNTTASDPFSNSPTDNPTFVLLYAPPSTEDCAAIAVGNDVTLQNVMTVRTFEIVMDVAFDNEVDFTQYEDDLEQTIQESLAPALADCASDEQRKLRVLQQRPNQYVIGNAKVGLTFQQTESCDSTENSCYRISVILNLFLKGKERLLTLASLISDAFGSDPLASAWELPTPYQSVVIVIVNSKDETDSPTSEPSLVPTDSPPPSNVPLVPLRPVVLLGIQPLHL